MKSKMKTTAVREIKGSFGRFAAILSIIALGVGFFSGVTITTPSMISTIGRYLNEHEFYDYRLVSTIGWDDEDVKTIAAEDVLHDLGAFSMISSDSQAMGRVGEVVLRTA